MTAGWTWCADCVATAPFALIVVCLPDLQQLVDAGIIRDSTVMIHRRSKRTQPFVIRRTQATEPLNRMGCTI